MFASTWLQLTAAVSNNSLSAVARIYIQVSRELTTIVNIVDCRNSSGRAIFDPVVALNAGYAQVEFVPDSVGAVIHPTSAASHLRIYFAHIESVQGRSSRSGPRPGYYSSTNRI